MEVEIILTIILIEDLEEVEVYVVLQEEEEIEVLEAKPEVIINLVIEIIINILQVIIFLEEEEVCIIEIIIIKTILNKKDKTIEIII